MIKYIIDNEYYNPISRGQFGDFDEGCEESATCHDCFAKVGEIHDEHCDAQRCPKCGGQFITCGCHTFVYDTETKKKHFVDKRMLYEFMENEKCLAEANKIIKSLGNEMD